MWIFTKLLLGLPCLWSSWPIPNLPVMGRSCAWQEKTEATFTRQSNWAFSLIWGMSTTTAANWACMSSCTSASSHVVLKVFPVVITCYFMCTRMLVHYWPQLAWNCTTAYYRLHRELFSCKLWECCRVNGAWDSILHQIRKHLRVQQGNIESVFSCWWMDG